MTDKRQLLVFPDYFANGLSLRDLFATAALQGILSYSGEGPQGNYHTNSSVEVVAQDAFRYADAMLKARTPA